MDIGNDNCVINFGSYQRVALVAEHGRRQIEGSVKNRHYAPSHPSLGLLSVASVEQEIRGIETASRWQPLCFCFYLLAYDIVLSGSESMFSEYLPSALRDFEQKNGYIK
jgi:hypothetical protein